MLIMFISWGMMLIVMESEESFRWRTKEGKPYDRLRDEGFNGGYARGFNRGIIYGILFGSVVGYFGLTLLHNPIHNRANGLEKSVQSQVAEVEKSR